MVAAMDKVGVDGAIYISPFSMFCGQPEVRSLSSFARSTRKTRVVRSPLN
jgi:hypothetical protein